MTDQLLSIGAVAQRTGLAVSAVRYYDEIGLINTKTRIGGKRRFAPETVGRVNFVRRAQDAGFSLDQVASILDDNSGRWRALVDSKLDELIDQRSRIDSLISMLTEIRECGCDVVSTCTQYGDVSPRPSQ